MLLPSDRDRQLPDYHSDDGSLAVPISRYKKLHLRQLNRGAYSARFPLAAPEPGNKNRGG
jgi:hypothetical protein